MSTPSKRPLILLVDADVGGAKLLQIYLERQGYGVVAASDAFGAYQIARRHRPDAIVSEIALEEQDEGWTLLRLVRLDYLLRETVFLFYTAQSDEEHWLTDTGLTPDATLSKEPQLEHFAHVMTRALEPLSSLRERLEGASSPVNGRLGTVGAISLLRILDRTAGSGRLVLTTAGGRGAALQLREGQILSAELLDPPRSKGIDAMERVATWEWARYRFDPGGAGTATASPIGAVESVLSAACERAQERAEALMEHGLHADGPFRPVPDLMRREQSALKGERLKLLERIREGRKPDEIATSEEARTRISVVLFDLTRSGAVRDVPGSTGRSPAATTAENNGPTVVAPPPKLPTLPRPPAPAGPGAIKPPSLTVPRPGATRLASLPTAKAVLEGGPTRVAPTPTAHPAEDGDDNEATDAPTGGGFVEASTRMAEVPAVLPVLSLDADEDDEEAAASAGAAAPGGPPPPVPPASTAPPPPPSDASSSLASDSGGHWLDPGATGTTKAEGPAGGAVDGADSERPSLANDFWGAPSSGEAPPQEPPKPPVRADSTPPPPPPVTVDDSAPLARIKLKRVAVRKSDAAPTFDQPTTLDASDALAPVPAASGGAWKLIVAAAALVVVVGVGYALFSGSDGGTSTAVVGSRATGSAATGSGTSGTAAATAAPTTSEPLALMFPDDDAATGDVADGSSALAVADGGGGATAKDMETHAEPPATAAPETAAPATAPPETAAPPVTAAPAPKTARPKTAAPKTARPPRTTRPRTAKPGPVVDKPKTSAPKKAADPAAARKHYATGNKAFLSGNKTGAVAAYKKAIAADPAFSDPWRGLAITYSALGKKKDASRALSKYAAMKPGAPGLDALRRKIESMP